MKNLDKETVGKHNLQRRVKVFKSKIPNIVRSLFLWSARKKNWEEFQTQKKQFSQECGV